MNLHTRINVNGQGAGRVVSGRALALELKNASATQRAAIAADIASGRVIVTPLPVRWANRICNANQIRAKAARTNKQKSASDDRLDRLLNELGIDRVFGALDRLTSPVSA
jgi:hypothetical protein